MIRGHVIGRYWATKKIEHIPSGAFLEVETEGGSRIIAIDVLGFDAGFEELIPEMDRVRHPDGEHYGGAVLSESIPVADNVAHELVGIHTALKLPDRIVTGLGFYAAEIGIDRRIAERRHEIALLDQVRHLRSLDDSVEDAAEAAPVSTAGCSGQTEHGRVWICC